MIHIFIFLFCRNKNIIISDIEKDLEHHSLNLNTISGLVYLLTHDKYFRNVFYFRIGRLKFICKWLAPPYLTFTIGTYTPIGKGLLAVHPFSSVINASSIGENLTIRNNVTIGQGKNGLPTIKDNVEINVGAIIIGDIVIGNNVIIGAGAVVTKDIPDNCTVVGNPAYIIRKNGVKVKEFL